MSVQVLPLFTEYCSFRLLLIAPPLSDQVMVYSLPMRQASAPVSAVVGALMVMVGTGRTVKALVLPVVSGRPKSVTRVRVAAPTAPASIVQSYEVRALSTVLLMMVGVTKLSVDHSTRSGPMSAPTEVQAMAFTSVADHNSPG